MDAKRIAIQLRQWAPTRWFRGGEQGAIYLPSVFSSMFQDSGMTQPVTAFGQAVVKMLDLSGRGNTITFANVTVEQNAAGFAYLAANGTTSSGATAAIDFTGTNKMTMVAGVLKTSDAARAIFAETSSGGLTGSIALQAPSSAGANNYVYTSFGSLGVNAIASSYASTVSSIVTGISDIGNDIAQIRVNGIVKQTTTTDQGTGNFGNHPLYVFMRNSATLPFTGGMYGLILRGAPSTETDVVRAERYLARLSGVSL